MIEVESVHLADENRTYVDQDDEVAESLEDKETVSKPSQVAHTHTHIGLLGLPGEFCSILNMYGRVVATK